MKNIKIVAKMLGGFLTTAAIILAVGLLSIQQQRNLAHESEVFSKEELPAMENILAIKSEAAIISSLMRTLLTPYATKEQREFSHKQLLESRKVYGAAKDKFLSLSIMNDIKDEWQDFNSNITKWATINNQAVELSKDLITMDLIQPAIMKAHVSSFEIAHNSLLGKVGKLISLNIPFEGGTGDTNCSLGKWLQNMDTTNTDLVALAKEIKPVHSKLHQHVADIKNLAAGGQLSQAKELYEKQLIPASEQVFEIANKMGKIADGAYEKFTKMNTLLLQDAATLQTNTFAAIDKIVVAVDKNAKKHVTDTNATADQGRLITIICLLVGVAIAVCSGFLLTRTITKPLFKGVDLAKAMADGDLTKTMDVDQKDEIGILAKSLNEMATQLRRMFSDINGGVVRVDESSTQLAAIANQMNAGAESTASRSSQVAAAAEEMSANQSSIAAAMEQASVNVNMVATATDEMSATINEIASNSSKAKDITTMAVRQSQKASERVHQLGKAADEINKVTEAITDISEQTNLLALNATIEAARAGEAGKGFAVVANEIKDLARQTAAATLDIKNKIQGVQEATGVTVKEINEIGQVIADVDKIVATIAAAVEEQTATTKEIAQNVQQASQGIAEVNENVAQSSTVSAEIASDIATVNSSANEMRQASSQVKVSAEELSVIADRLKEMMAKFKT